MRERFSKIAQGVADATGTPWAFGLALGFILGWAASGPMFGFSDTWQLVVNTTTTIITFLMVFLIQSSQDRDTKAIHVKLDELITRIDGPRNEMAGAENMPEATLKTLLSEQRHEAPPRED